MTHKLAVSFECTPVREIHVNPDDPSPVVAVVEAVADVEGVDPTKLPSLGDTIDPDLIDQFVTFAEPNTDSLAGLCFTYSGWNVFVRADGTIIIGDPNETNTPTPLF